MLGSNINEHRRKYGEISTSNAFKNIYGPNWRKKGTER